MELALTVALGVGAILAFLFNDWLEGRRKMRAWDAKVEGMLRRYKNLTEVTQPTDTEAT